MCIPPVTDCCFLSFLFLFVFFFLASLVCREIYFISFDQTIVSGIRTFIPICRWEERGPQYIGSSLRRRNASRFDAITEIQLGPSSLACDSTSRCILGTPASNCRVEVTEATRPGHFFKSFKSLFCEVKCGSRALPWSPPRPSPPKGKPVGNGRGLKRKHVDNSAPLTTFPRREGKQQ